ncbi:MULTISPECIES: hypothetical protein [Sphingomonadaceae]|jgi:hypothetical protein|uniref:Uncharacterized protein n=4 Tax=Sphingomonadaceae TaxID=41297 RepID=A0A285R1D9_9SPHN|nr:MULTISPECIES: hypothetical protein [Sphingomonas]GLK21956.1 hypothetical protein GCM10017606_27830 [Microbacterium terregens]KQO57111.1 hypothetical protein ASF14_17070 [Sphingomonas sp. Leaf257]NJB99671.1 hypothetical protein [Sphingomonas trueperi]NNG55774.1 hypothetical protein [Sphingomonas sanguinis]SEJ99775.1 hypothetical protein SAMN05428950_10963 [Sphingomonas sp. OV641]
MPAGPGTSSSPRELVTKAFDSAFVIATILAAIYFAGWTYRQAYFGRFAIDPTNLGGSNIAVAVEGLGAIITTTGAWLTAILPLLIVTALTLIAGKLFDRARAASHRPPFFDPLTLFMARVGCGTIVILIVVAAGHVAGTIRAKDRIGNITRGEVWIYHLEGKQVSGITLGQSNDMTWVLTKEGVRPLKTAEIQLIDGALFNRVATER